MRSSTSLLFSVSVTFAAGISLSQGGCAAFADLPEYKLAPGGGGQAGTAGGSVVQGGRGGTSIAGGGGANVGGADGGGGTGTAGASGAAAGGGGTPQGGGAAGEGAGGGSPKGGAGGSGDGGGGAANGGDAGATGTAGVGGAGAAAGSSGSSGATAGGVGGSGGTSGQSGASGAGDSGAAGGPAGSAGSGDAGGAAGSVTGGGQGGAVTALPETVAQGQIDPGTLLLHQGVLYWVNRGDGSSGQVAKLPLPGATTNPAASPSFVQPSVTALKDIALYADRLFVLRGEGQTPQKTVLSYALDGTQEVAVQRCVDDPGGLAGLGAVPCKVTALRRMVAASTGVFFSGEAQGTASSVVAGVKSCGAGPDSCTAFLDETPAPSVLTAVDGTLFSVSSTNKKRVVRTPTTKAPGMFVDLPDDILDLSNDGVTLFALTSTGGVMSIEVTSKSVTPLVVAQAGLGGQRVLPAGDHVYWTATGGGTGQGVVGRVRKDGGGLELLSSNRKGPRGLAVDTTSPNPAVYFTDVTNTVQRIRLP